MGVWDKVKATASAAGESIKDGAASSKYKIKIKEETAAINDVFTEIGKYFYTKVKADLIEVPAEIMDKIDEVDGHMAEIDECKRKIEEIKND